MAGFPIAVLGTALLIHFRHPGADVGYLVMCQIFNGFYSGIWAPVAQLAIMASIGHQEVAVSLAIFSLFGGIGAAIGNAIAGGIWNNILPDQLYKHLPAGDKDLVAEIFSSLAIQQDYPKGTPEIGRASCRERVCGSV